MTTIGWIIFGVLCAIVIGAVVFSSLLNKKCKWPEKVISLVIAVAICLGLYFGGLEIFRKSVEVEEPAQVTEEQVEVTEAPAEENTEEAVTAKP